MTQKTATAPEPSIDAFTLRRLKKFIETHRTRTGSLPTLRDLKDGGFEDPMIKAAIKCKVLDEFYVTLTNGSVVKGFKVVDKANRTLDK